ALAKSLVMVILIAVAINLPWMYRNYTVTHALTPISTVGTTLDGAYNDCELRNGMWGTCPSINYADFCPQHVADINPDFCPYTTADEKIDTDQALSWMRAHISALPTLFSLHLYNFWTPYMQSFGLPFEVTSEMPVKSHYLQSAIYFMPALITKTTIPVFLLAAFGFIVTWKRKYQHLLLCYLTMALTILQSVVFYGSPRFRAPIEPILVLLVGGALWWLLCDAPGTLRHRQTTSS
ncbi:MAG: hypothetical protein ACRDHW_21190, partial [Ktedonobacteraceae bacterium]